MSNFVRKVELVPGFLQITEDNGHKYQIAITDVLRAVDVPNLNIDSLTLLTNLAQVVSVLIKTLFESGVITENLADDYDMDYVVETLEDELEAEF